MTTKASHFFRAALPLLVALSASVAFAADTPAPPPPSDLEQEKAASAAYLTQMAAEPGAQTLDQGVVLRAIHDSGSGQFPTAASTVSVSYLLTDREGKLIEESLTSDELAEFPLSKLISCWQIAFPKIAVGSFYKLTCPSGTAYGDKGVAGVIKGGAALTFRVTLFGTK